MTNDRYSTTERSTSSLGDYYSTKKSKKIFVFKKSSLKFLFFQGGDLLDRHVTPITMVFDELKDYLSESDLSLDYKIAKSRNNKKKKRVYRNSRIFGSDNTYYNHQGIILLSSFFSRKSFCKIAISFEAAHVTHFELKLCRAPFFCCCSSSKRRGERKLYKKRLHFKGKMSHNFKSRRMSRKIRICKPGDCLDKQYTIVFCSAKLAIF